MLGKLKSMINALFYDVVSFFPVKGCVLNITGAGATNPTINSSYNVSSVVWVSTGTYTINLTRDTIYGLSVTDNSSLSCTWSIEPILATDAFKVDAEFSAGVITLTVYQLTVAGARNVRTLVDLQNTDKVSLSLIMSGGADLPPA